MGNIIALFISQYDILIQWKLESIWRFYRAYCDVYVCECEYYITWHPETCNHLQKYHLGLLFTFIFDVLKFECERSRIWKLQNIFYWFLNLKSLNWWNLKTLNQIRYHVFLKQFIWPFILLRKSWYSWWFFVKII